MSGFPSPTRAIADEFEFSVEALEIQVVDLQTESTRLLRSLDLQKDEAAREAASTSRKVKELSRENVAGEEEITTLKQKLKQFADYDEVKRELDIMKVSRCIPHRELS